VNDLHAHIKYVSENWSDKSAALALLDHFRECPDQPTPSALRFVAALRHAGRLAAELSEATAVLRAEHPYCYTVCCAIRKYVDRHVAWHATIYVVPGRKRPTLTGPAVSTNPPPAGAFSIVVGARFVCLLAQITRLAHGIDSPHRRQVLDYIGRPF